MELLNQIELLLNQKGIDKKKLSMLTGFTPNQLRRMFIGGMTVKELYRILPIVEKELSLH